MAFLNGFLLSAMVLASVPIIIHLLNRRRFQVVDWAPMKYLKLTLKTNRRRLRIEQLILLAVRTLVVVLLILAVARPLLSAGAGARWLPGRQRTSRVVVIDNSLSMAYAVAGRSALDRAKDAARELLGSQSSLDLLTVLTTAHPAQPVVNEIPLDPANITRALQGVTQTDTRSDWPAILQQVDRTVAAATFPSREIVLMTDLRRSGWDDVSAIANHWAEQGVRMMVIDVGSPETANVTLLSLEQEDPIALPEEPVHLKARVRNDTSSLITGVSAVLQVGGETDGESSRPVLLPELPPGQTADVPLTVSSPKPGQLPVRLTLLPDALSLDNTRTLCLNFRSTIDLGMVDGEPGARPFESETDFLSLAFSIGKTPWHIAKSTEPEWNANLLAPADVYVLANVASPSAKRLAELEALVRRGAGLMVFVGDQVDINAYNDRLYHDGDGLLPARLTGVTDEPVTGLVVEALPQSPVEPLAKLAPAALARLQTKKYMSVQIPAGKSQSVRVLARWNNSEGSPALIEKQVGRGRVLLWTIPADKAWGDWPLDPAFVLAVRSAVAGITSDDAGRFNVTAGQSARLALDAGAAALEPTVTLPNGETAQAGSVDGAVLFDRTEAAGTYRFDWKDAQGRGVSRLLVVGPDKAESDLQRIGDDELLQRTGSLRPTIVHYAGESSLTTRGREIWRALATATLVLFVTEMLLATWVGRQR